MASAEEITRHEDDDDPGDEIWVRGRPAPAPIAVVEPDPGWPGAYRRVAELVRAALGDRVLGLEHVGSTSVPGLPAKPVIDIDLTVADPADEDSYVPDLEAAGFLLIIREADWHEHRLLSYADPKVHLHVWGPGSPEAIRHVIFRDWLVDHPDDRDLYAEAKRRAAAETNAAESLVMHYNRRKQPVIRDILDRAFRHHGLL